MMPDDRDTLNSRFLDVYGRYADRPVLLAKKDEQWEEISVGSLSESALRIAAWLKAQGLKDKESVAILLANGPDWVRVYFGILLAGGVCVPLDPQLGAEDAKGFFNDADVHIVFAENKTIESWGTETPEEKIFVLPAPDKNKCHASLQDILSSGSPLAQERIARPQPDDIASILYSSGTTSDPKGIELSHANFLANFQSVSALNVCSQKDTFISVLPLFHAYAFMATLIVPLFTGARIVYPAAIQSDAILSALREQKVTMFVGVPELFYKIYNTVEKNLKSLSFPQRVALRLATKTAWWVRRTTGLNLPKVVYKKFHQKLGGRVRYWVSGGAALDAKIAQGLMKMGLTVLEGYGLTETAPLVTLNPPQRPKIGSVGRPVPGVEVRIAKAEEKQEDGEILIRGANIMRGYHRKPWLYKEVVRDGWFYSGDLGRLDKDGYLYISGRKKEMIVLRSGKNIFPDEVEHAYARTEFIKEIGVFYSQEEAKPGLKAVIVPDLERFKRSGVFNIREKIHWDVENISKQLPAYKRIMGFVIVRDELPKTRLGKIKHFQLPDIFRQAQEGDNEFEQEDPVEDALIRSQTGRRVVDFLKKELNIKRTIHSRDHLELDLGVDSLTRVEMTTALERQFHIKMPEEYMGEIATVHDLIVKIDTLLSSDGAKDYKERGESSYWQDLLFADYPPEQAAAINLSPRWFNRCVSFLIRGLIWVLFKAACRLTVKGREHLPAKGPYILACNHTSYLDAFVVIAGLPFPIAIQSYFIGTRDIFNHPTVRWANRFIRVIMIDSSKELVNALQASSHVLKNDKILCIFPEGQRSIDGEVKTFKKGVGILSKELNVPVVPVAIWGAHQAWPRAVRFPRPHPITVAFGRPENPREIIGDKQPEDEGYEVIACKLKEKVQALHNTIRPDKQS